MSAIAGLWLSMLQDAALPGNPSGWNVPNLFAAISEDPDLNQGDRAAIWRSLTADERDRLKAAGQGAAGQ